MRKPFGSLLIALCVVLGGPATAQDSPAKPCAEDPLFAQFDYLLGTWDVLRQGRKTAQVRWEKALNGCGITEHWTSVNPGRGDGLGLMTYSRLRGSPTYYWISDNGGNTSYVAAEARPNDITFLTQTPHPSGTGTRARRFQLASQPDGTILERSLASDNGGPFQPEFELIWHRVPAPEAR